MADERYISNRVIKQLYALSGNECANPSCHNKLVYPDDDAKNDQICHIEAASANGPRFNPNQTDDERRSFDNLILLCHKCHNMIDNNPDAYTVELLKKWKRDHEAKYKDNYKPKTFSFSVPQGLLPRDKEVDTLYDGIINNRFFNLVGVGGSGKSSLTYLMMQKHKDDFNEIVYVVVNNNIKDDFVEQINKTLRLEFEKDDDSFSELIAHLQNNFKSEHPNLLVLDIIETTDNRNNEIINWFIQNEDILNGWKILILSREKVDILHRIDTHNLNDKKDVEFLKQLFLSKAGIIYNDLDNFAELFKILYYNPILTEQLGLYLSKLPNKKSLEEIKSILFKNKDFNGMSAHTNDSIKIKMYLNNILPFDTDYLNHNEKKLLRHFVLWQTDFINYEAIKQLLKNVFKFNYDLEESLDQLSDRAIIMTKNTGDGNSYYKLHDILSESLREKIDISTQDYSAYLNNIEELIIKENLSYSEATECIANSLFNYNIIDISSFFGNIVLKSKTKQSTKDFTVPEYIALAPIYNNIGMLYDRKGNKEIANKYYQKAKNVYEQLTIDNSQPKSNTEEVDKNKEISKGKELTNKINNCPKGKEGWSQFEEIGGEVFTYLFADSFRNYKCTIQETTTDGIFRRDMIVYNTFKESPSFWQLVKEDYNANLIIIDFKNYTDLLNPDQFYNPSKYMNKLAGHFAIVISRCGLNESAKKLQLKLLEEEKLIMCLSDFDLINLINHKMQGQDPLCAIEEMYYTLCQHK